MRYKVRLKDKMAFDAILHLLWQHGDRVRVASERRLTISADDIEPCDRAVIDQYGGRIEQDYQYALEG